MTYELFYIDTDDLIVFVPITPVAALYNKQSSESNTLDNPCNHQASANS